jgi:hypothetical protein
VAARADYPTLHPQHTIVYKRKRGPAGHPRTRKGNLGELAQPGWRGAHDPSREIRTGGGRGYVGGSRPLRPPRTGVPPCGQGRQWATSTPRPHALPTIERSSPYIDGQACSVSRVTRTGYSRAVRWVQKVTGGGEEANYTAYVVLDAQARQLNIPLKGVSEADAEAMVATGDWKYVYEVDRPEGQY